LVPGCLSGPKDHFGDELCIFGGEIVEASDMFSRNDEKMDWGMGMNVLEDDQRLILMEEISLFPSANDLAENTIGVHRNRGFPSISHRRAYGVPSSDTTKQDRSNTLLCL
jgi:hypothetical protein